jgi:murein DD-endopeptidase MepM/ murein hydrolase activator NlpD
VEQAWCATRDDAGAYEVTRLRLPVTRALVVLEGVLLGSWREALVAAGAPLGLGARAATLFPRAPRGDRPRPFRLVVEKRTVEGRFLGYGPIEALELEDGERVRTAYRFPVAGRRYAYYDEAGRPLRKRRLPPPVLDATLTSRFGRRRHPIRRRWRFHRGVDYGASRGEPVYAVATGTVASAGYKRGLGRTVALGHARGLVTRYAHLRRIAAGLVRGDVVHAGDLLGFVGSSGMSTGPHLHFETIVRGRHVNPLRYRPPAPPALDAAGLERFRARVGKIRALLAAQVS